MSTVVCPQIVESEPSVEKGDTSIILLRIMILIFVGIMYPVLVHLIAGREPRFMSWNIPFFPYSINVILIIGLLYLLFYLAYKQEEFKKATLEKLYSSDTEIKGEEKDQHGH